MIHWTHVNLHTPFATGTWKITLFWQIVCSFLVRDMGIDWRMGAEWFETCLLDYDPCSNYGNWTYGSGKYLEVYVTLSVVIQMKSIISTFLSLDKNPFIFFNMSCQHYYVVHKFFKQCKLYSILSYIFFFLIRSREWSQRRPIFQHTKTSKCLWEDSQFTLKYGLETDIIFSKFLNLVLM